MLTITINGTDFALASNLRVAYELQGCNNHQPYTKVFDVLGEQTLEKQIELLYCAFKVGNPTAGVTKQMFVDAVLDNYNLKELMTMIKKEMNLIMGRDEDQGVDDTNTDAPASETTGGDEGNS